MLGGASPGAKIVGVIEAPDDESATAALLALGSQGNVRTRTMRGVLTRGDAQGDRDELIEVSR